MMLRPVHSLASNQIGKFSFNLFWKTRSLITSGLALNYDLCFGDKTLDNVSGS